MISLSRSSNKVARNRSQFAGRVRTSPSSSFLTVFSSAPTAVATTKAKSFAKYWTGIAGNAITNLTSSPNYPSNPTGSDFRTSFEAPTDWGDNYGTRMRGYIHPPVSGNYRFWIASDDNSSLRLSTSSNPASATQIAAVTVWTSPREWTKYPSQQSALINLQAGQRYYIEALQKRRRRSR